uniref:B cell scaffold protein with ankyrin repeats 1 n=1 Tax=Ursus americanus TaxID=9643 RepID=A0A452RGZ8_URSAM
NIPIPSGTFTHLQSLSVNVFTKKHKARMESQGFSTVDCLAAGQEELILLQEKVKNGKLSVDEALEKFKHWQLGKTELEMIQQEKLRQLRDCIVGKRPEEENVSGLWSPTGLTSDLCSVTSQPHDWTASTPWYSGSSSAKQE